MNLYCLVPLLESSANIIIEELRVTDESLKDELRRMLDYITISTRQDVEKISKDVAVYNTVVHEIDQNDNLSMIPKFTVLYLASIDKFLRFRINRIVSRMDLELKNSFQYWLKKVAKSEKIW